MDKIESGNGAVENGVSEDGRRESVGGGGTVCLCVYKCMWRQIENEPAKWVWLKLHKLDLLMEDSDHFKNEYSAIAAAAIACCAIFQLLN